MAYFFLEWCFCLPAAAADEACSAVLSDGDFVDVSGDEEVGDAVDDEGVFFFVGNVECAAVAGGEVSLFE